MYICNAAKPLNPLKRKRTKKKNTFRNPDNIPVYIHTLMYVRVRVPKI